MRSTALPAEHNQDCMVQAPASSVRSLCSPPCFASALSLVERWRTPPRHFEEQALRPRPCGNSPDKVGCCAPPQPRASVGGYLGGDPEGATKAERGGALPHRCGAHLPEMWGQRLVAWGLGVAPTPALAEGGADVSLAQMRVRLLMRVGSAENMGSKFTGLFWAP